MMLDAKFPYSPFYSYSKKYPDYIVLHAVIHEVLDYDYNGFSRPF